MRNISIIGSHTTVYVFLSSLSIIVQFVESVKNLSNLPPNLSPNVAHYNSQDTSIVHSANGKFQNITLIEPISNVAAHKLPPSLISVDTSQFEGNSALMLPEPRLELDMNEVVLTNLNAERPSPVVIKSHAEFARENDRFPFSRRYLSDNNAAIGNAYPHLSYCIITYRNED